MRNVLIKFKNTRMLFAAILLLLLLSFVLILSSCTITIGGLPGGTNNNGNNNSGSNTDNGGTNDSVGGNNSDGTDKGDSNDDSTDNGDNNDTSDNGVDNESNENNNDNVVYLDNIISVQNGYLSTGKISDSVSYGEEVTLYAFELNGMYFDYWTKNGEPIRGGEILDVTADIQSVDEPAEVIYVACYSVSECAEFDDVPDGTFSSLNSNRYDIMFDSSSDNVYAEVVTNAKNDWNSVIKYVDYDPSASGALRIDIAAVAGDYIVYNLDFLVESYLGAIPISIKTGNYAIDFYSTGTKLKVCDVAGSTTAYLKSSFEIGVWHNLKIYVSSNSGNGTDPHSFVFIDGECIAESYNVPSYSSSGTISFFSSGQSEVVAYLDNIGAYRTNLTEEELSAMEPAYVIEKGYKNTDAYYEAEIILDEGAFLALKEMDKALFSEDIYRWIAELYDPETSAIYFSVSGRDNYGYLPDIETVAQAYGILSTLGLGGASSVLNDEQKANLLSWIQTLQSNRDGYYYHPHWGVSINNSRLSRDLGSSGSAYNASGSLAYRLFDDANYRLSGGASGYLGVTIPSVYDNRLTVRLTTSQAYAVSKLIMSYSMSSMPYHLRSEENLVRHINEKWNETCKVEGEHERHFCTESCILVDDPSDSYMKIEDGKQVITRGKRCISCHECSHTVGHSYSFGHYVTSMGTQIRSAGLGTPTVMYFYDIQENVQASLRDKAQAAYIAENGENAWNALSYDEQTAIRAAAENGIWEEEITYNTISGLLKICGIPTTHGYEFLYAKQAINSAIDGALFSTDDFIARRESIVSIYNPFNAINGIMGNINKYGKDASVRSEAMALIRSRAEELINNTTVKLACYLMPDGGYSYNMNGYCTTSQGQPVAVNGWNGGVGEGDVNGTALALGTRGALVQCLGLNIGAPFAGERAKYSENGYDLDCNGIIEADELEATHRDVFKSLITNKSEIEKVGYSKENNGQYLFDVNPSAALGNLTVSPTDSKDKVFVLKAGQASDFKAYHYSEKYCIYNFNSFQGQVYLGKSKAGDRIYYEFTDSTSSVITGIYLEINSDTTVSVYAANGQMLTMANRGGNPDSAEPYLDMTLNADTSRWLTVKLEYHHDLSEPQLDVVIRYADKDNNSYNKTVAATLTGVSKIDKDALANDFTNFNIEYSTEGDGRIYLDDLYIRNVLVP